MGDYEKHNVANPRSARLRGLSVIVSVNPASGEELARFDPHTAKEVDAALSAAVQAQRAWRVRSIAERVPLLRAVADVLRNGKDKYAELITVEMGKPISEAQAEIEKCAVTCDHYAEHAGAYLADRPVSSNATESMIVHDPLGVVLAIMPWNFPFWQFFRFAAPALAAGNGAILKHASNVPQCSLAIAQVLSDAGAPQGLVHSLLIEADQVTSVLEDDRIAAVTLTGSTEVGAIVAAKAGSILKKQVLELGGSDPFVVLGDADVDEAAKTAVKSRFINTGQSCVNAKRFIVEQSVAEEFTAKFSAGTAALAVGNPMDPGTEIGPMARDNLRESLHDQVKRTIVAGATLVLGGAPIEGPGFFYAPTVLDDVSPGMAAFDEETFGPVAAITHARDVEDAIALANRTQFGLGAAIWSRDLDRARQLAHRIDAGAVFINGMVASDARLPFGGIKKSGYGRELGADGIREFVNIKTVWIGPVNTGTNGGNAR